MSFPDPSHPMHVQAFATAILPDGLRLPYVERGDPAGPALLLLHGYTDSWRSFAPVLPHLPTTVRAVAVTQRGHGEAGRPAAGYAPRDFSDDLAAFMDGLGIDRAVVAGHSMGSAIAQRFALDHPDRVAGIVLAGTFATARGNPGVEQFWGEAVSTLQDPVDEAFAREFQEATLARPIPAAFLATVVAESLKTPAFVWRAALDGLRRADHSAELARIRQPTLLLWGDRDAFFPRADQDAVLSAIPGARLRVYEGAGHGLHWEQPERFARDLAGFVAETGRAARAAA